MAVETPSAELEPRQRLFALEWLVDHNAKQAAIRAGYSAHTAEQQGSRLLGHAQVKALIAQATKKREARLEIDVDRVLLEVIRVLKVDLGEAYDEQGMFLPLKQMPEDVRRAIASIETEEMWEGRGEDRVQVGIIRKVKFWPKLEAAKLAGTHLGMFIERQEIKVIEMTDEDRAARVAELLALGGKTD